MKGLESIESTQKEVARFLSQSYLKNRLLHAYIFEGPVGVKKLETAKLVAKMILCESDEPICHECLTCQLIQDQLHANVTLVKPDGQSIKKEQIQQLQADFSKTAMENKAKIYIIEDADKMSSSAANSLLKFLEEPSKNTYAILLTQNKQALLSTIRSRAVTVSFKSLPLQNLKESYENEGASSQALLLATLTQNVSEGLALAQQECFQPLVQLTLDTVDSLVKKSLDPTILISKHHDLLKEREHQLLYLKLMMIFFEDVIDFQLQKQTLKFDFAKDKVKTSAGQFRTPECVQNIQLLLETEKKIMSHANVLLSLDQLFYKMKGGYYDVI